MFPKIDLFKEYLFMIYMGPKYIHFYERKISTLEFVLPSRQPYHSHNVIMIFININLCIFVIGVKGTIDAEMIM